MAKTISFSQALAANQFVAQQGEVNDSPFNPVERTSRVSVYAVTSVAGGRLNLQLGGETHANDIVLPIGAAVSTRDNLVSTGIAVRGQKITVGLREALGATPTVNGMIVIEPM